MSGIEAYDLGKEDGAAEEQKRIINLIQAEIGRVSNPMLVDREYLDGLEEAISIIKRKSK